MLVLVVDSPFPRSYGRSIQGSNQDLLPLPHPRRGPGRRAFQLHGQRPRRARRRGRHREAALIEELAPGVAAAVKLSLHA